MKCIVLVLRLLEGTLCKPNTGPAEENQGISLISISLSHFERNFTSSVISKLLPEIQVVINVTRLLLRNEKGTEVWTPLASVTLSQKHP